MSERAESMVERVARAIWNADIAVAGNAPVSDAAWSEMWSGRRRELLEASARAAIAAMREPTEAQYNALCATNKMWREMNSEFVWQTYIDAALK